MTNPDNVGGLPELPAPRGYLHIFNQGRSYGSVQQVNGYTADQMRAYGELCRAAPAGGDAEVVRLRQLLAGTQEQFRVVSELLERNQAHHERMMKLMDSAPAGGESFVTFENGHMKLDVNAFLKSPEGLAQLKSIRAASEHFAPAGSGEVEQMAKRLDDARAIEEETSGLEDTIDAMRTAAALLRKLQQGAE